MALVNLTNLDFDQIKTSLKDYLRSNSNFTDYNFEGSNLSVLIDTLAYNTYISSYNANMVSNEVFIDSATLRENVVSLARNIGYVPQSRVSARASISFFVDTSGLSTNPLTLTLKKGIVCTSANNRGNNNFSFAIPNDITVPVVDGIAFFDDVDVFEGAFLTSNFTVSSLNPQRYILDNANIDTSSITVTVRDSQASTTSRKFVLSDNLLSVTSTSRVFFIQEIEDQRYELIFGDGVFGEKLADDSFIEVSYVTTNGRDGNGVSSFSFSGRIVDNNNNIVTSSISLISANTSSTGGKEIESVESIKKYATRLYSAQNRAVTTTDYESIIPIIYPETESVSVFGGEDLTPPQFGRVFITIKPTTGSSVPNSVKNNIKKELRRYSVAGIVPEILDIKYVYVEPDITAYYNTNLASSADAVRTLIFDNITSYSNSTEMNRYGARFKFSKFQKVIDDSNESITSNITKIQIRRNLSARVNVLANYEVCFGNPFYIKDNEGYNIKSSGFNVEGIADICYLADVPSSNKKTGNLFLFTNPGLENPTVVNSSVGTIDYEKGEINLKQIQITSTVKTFDGDPIIEISACPLSNDVVGKQDLYLQLDINNTTLNMAIDDVSSGADVSASLYSPITSYTNGIRVRR